MAKVEYKPIGKELFQVVAETLGHDVANVYLMITSHGPKKEERMLASAGPRILMRHEEFLRRLMNEGKNYDGLKELHALILRALAIQEGTVPETAEKLLQTPMHPDVKNIKSSLRISKREKPTIVKHKDYSMIYYPDGNYYIYKGGKELTHGLYDAVLADSYNSQMSDADREQHLSEDLITWVEKSLNQKKKSEIFDNKKDE